MKTYLRILVIAVVLGRYLLTFLLKRVLFFKQTSFARETRLSFEALGTTFIKFGQIIGMNPGIFSESFVEEFKKCLDDVNPLPWSTIEPTLQEELGDGVFESFSSFEKDALSSASIAQVHNATLGDGTEVVVKVQRPHIIEVVEADIAALKLIFSLIVKVIPSLRPTNPVGLVEKFDEKIHEELNFIQEGKNCERFFEIFEGDEDIVVPRVFWDLTTRRVLTMERVSGIKISNAEQLKERGVDLSQSARLGMKVLVKSAFEEGFFHGDMHAANIIVTEGGGLGLVDFGIMESLDKELKKNVLTLLYSVYAGNFTDAAIMMKEVSLPDNDVDDSFYDAVREVGQKYLGTSLQGQNWREFISETLTNAHKYRLRLPLTLVLLLKQLLYLDGLGRMMDLNYDLLQHGGFFSEYFSLLLRSNES